MQLALVLALLKNPGRFVLCGDSHQIVHPNFFSWATLKSLFWQGLAGDAAQRQPLHLLQANFRNTRQVTELANRLLKIKQARFGSVDHESNFLVSSTSGEGGQVRLLDAEEQLDAATRQSARHAVIVLRDEDKPAARQAFRTPLIFSVHQAKGLEYPHVLPLHDVLAELPPWLWADRRRKRSYVNQVLARAEVFSAYQPARRLWVRTCNGHDFPNP